MTKEDLKINLIYFYEKHKDDIHYVFLIITIPIWLPVFIVLFPFFFCDVENLKEDQEWCEKNGYKFPHELECGAHKVVKKWRKDYNDKIKAEEKEKIRLRLEFENKWKNSSKK
jgi:hypothetical protein